MYFGTFDTAVEAAKVYDLAAFPKDNYSQEDIENVTPSTMKHRKRVYKRKGNL